MPHKNNIFLFFPLYGYEEEQDFMVNDKCGVFMDDDIVFG